MDANSLKSWRKAQRERLIAERLAIPDATLEAWRERMDGFLERSFPGLGGRRVAFCWPPVSLVAMPTSGPLVAVPSQKLPAGTDIQAHPKRAVDHERITRR